MTRPRASIVCMLFLAACGREQPRQAAADSRRGEPTATRVAATAPRQDTVFSGTTAVTQLRRAGPPVTLRAGSAAAAPGYDRIIFEFAGDSLPGYHVQYATRPVVRCGSGDPVTVAGRARLSVRLEPARAHDERGNATIVERERTLGLPAVKEMKLVCDFEGQVEWVVGVDSIRPYRITEASAPPRLIVDVGHPR